MKILSVWSFTISAWLLQLVHIQEIIAIVAGLLASGYTGWRWLRDLREEKKKNKK